MGQAERYFLDSDVLARERFRKTASTLSDALLEAFPIASASEDDLSIDVLTLPARVHPERVVVVTTGVHGVEGFAGSAVLQMLLEEVVPELDRSTTSFVFVHPVNPWGYRHRRRVTENNVDLNRNLSISPALFSTANALYGKLDEGLNPAGPVATDAHATIAAALRRLQGAHDRRALQQSIVRGQYEHPKGIYFGGRAFEPAHAVLDPVFRRSLVGHRSVFCMDLHTGFGERGRLHFFGMRGLGSETATRTVFEGYPIDVGGDDADFYETSGDMILYLGELAAAQGSTYVGMTMEYGTMDSHTEAGALRTLVTAIVENQGHHHGYVDDELRVQVQRAYLEAFCPSSLDWRRAVIEQSRGAFPLLLERFMGL